MNSENEYDFETARERKITLNLSDADIYKLSAQAGRGGLKVNELLENFIGDVINRTFSEGWGFAREWANIIEGKTEDSLLSYSLKKGITPGNIFGKYRDEIIKEYKDKSQNCVDELASKYDFTLDVAWFFLEVMKYRPNSKIEISTADREIINLYYKDDDLDGINNLLNWYLGLEPL